jgi:anti-sigma-K factor RskA
MTSPDTHTLAGAYALDAVDDLERARFSRHLAECEACLPEVVELQEAAAKLADLTIEAPPARLKAAVLAEVSGTRQIGPVVRVEEGGARRWRRWTAAAVAVGIIAVGAAAGGYMVQEQRVRAARQAAAQAQQVEAVLAAKDAVVHTADVNGGRVTVVVSSSLDKGVAVVNALPSPGTDRAYQLWVVKGDHPDNAGVLAAGAGSGTRLFAGVRGAGAFAISREPSGGSPAPTDRVAMFPLA